MEFFMLFSTNIGIMSRKYFRTKGMVPEGTLQMEEKAIDQCSLNKSSRKSRIRAFVTGEMSKRRSRHRRSSSCPTGTQLEPTDSINHLESTNLDVELRKKVGSLSLIDEENGNCFASSPLELLLPNAREKPVTESQKCEWCSSMQKPTYANELGEDTSLKKSNKFINALDICGTKEFFLNILQDLSSYLRNRQALNSKVGLTKSSSFPVAGYAGQCSVMLSDFNDISGSYEAGENKLQSENKAQGSTFKSFDISMPSMAECKIDDISKPVMGRSKSLNYSSTRSPHGKKKHHENKLVSKHFKNLRQKIKHAIRLNSKDKHRIIMDAVFHRIPYGHKYSKNLKEESDDLPKKPDTEKCSKYNPVSSCESDNFVSALIKGKSEGIRRTLSFSNLLNRYCRLYESTVNNKAKHNICEGMKLKAEETPPPGERTLKSLGRIRSLPDLRACSILRGDDSPGSSWTSVRTFVDCNVSAGSRRLDERDTPSLTVLLKSQKQLHAPSESDHPKELAEYSETPNDLGNLTICERTCHYQNELEPATMLEKPSPNCVLSCNLEEYSASPANFSILEVAFLASQQHESSMNFSTAAESTVDIQKVEIPAKQYNGDFHNVQVDVRDIAKFNYVKDILELSGFCRNELLGAWQSPGQPLDSSMFEEVEGCLVSELDCPQNEEGRKCYHLLLYDLINEVLLEIHGNSLTHSAAPLTCRSHIRPMPVGYHVLEQVWAVVSGYLNWGPKSTQTLDDIVSWDLANGDRWMNLQSDAEFVVLELEDMIFDDLLDELT